MRIQEVGVNHEQLASGYVKAYHGKNGGTDYRVERRHIPLNKYLSGGHITEIQRHAGNRLYNLYITSSHLHSPVQMQYADLSGGLKEYERKFQINQEYMAAIMAINHKYRKAVQQVCLDEIKLGRGRMDELRLGLDCLVEFFKKIHKI